MTASVIDSVRVSNQFWLAYGLDHSFGVSVPLSELRDFELLTHYATNIIACVKFDKLMETAEC